MIFTESDEGRWNIGASEEGDWFLKKEKFKIKYHPEHTATVVCMVASCEYESSVVSIIVQIRKIKAKYKKEEYEYAIKTILSDKILLKYFGIEELEIPF